MAYKHRWIKRLIKNNLPEIDSIYLPKAKMRIAFSAKDMTGPSFHLSYGKDEGFQNYEEEDKDYIVEHLGNNQGYFIDIGANIGLFSFYILNKLPKQKIIAFEPEPQAFQCLQYSKEQNNFSTLELFNLAIGEKKEVLSFFVDRKNFGGHRMHRLSEQEKCIQVQSTPLQEFIGEQNSVSAIKIDVEGAELSVLKGIKEVIKKHRPLLMVECFNERISNKDELYTFISEFEGIRNVLLKDRRIISLEEMVEQAKLKDGKAHENYFFIFP